MHACPDENVIEMLCSWCTFLLWRFCVSFNSKLKYYAAWNVFKKKFAALCSLKCWRCERFVSIYAEIMLNLFGGCSKCSAVICIISFFLLFLFVLDILWAKGEELYWNVHIIKFIHAIAIWEVHLIQYFRAILLLYHCTFWIFKVIWETGIVQVPFDVSK